MSAGQAGMAEASGVVCPVGFVPEAVHNAALALSSGKAVSINGFFICDDTDHPGNLMLAINIVGLGVVWASLDQRNLETIADLMVATAPAPPSETLQ